MAKFVEGGPEAPDYGLPEVAPGEPLNARLQAHGTLEAFGGGKVLQGPIEAAEGLSQEAFQIAHQAKQRMDQVAVLDAVSKLQAKATDLMYDPKTGAITRRGRDAFGMPEQVRDSFQKTADDLSGNLTPEQRVMFQHHAVTIGGHLDRHVQAHVAGELKRYDDETTQAFLQNSQDAARLNYADQDQVDLSVYQQKAALVDYAHANGLPAEWLKLQQAQAASKTYGSVIESMHAAGQDQAAAETFKRYSEAGYFTGAERDKLSALVEHGNRLGEAERIVDGIFNPTPKNFDEPKPQPPQTLEDARSEARLQTANDPKLQQEAVRQVEHEWAVRETSQRMEGERVYQNLATQLRQTNSLTSIERLPEWETLPEHDKERLELLASRFAKGQKEFAPYDDLKTVTDLKLMSDDALMAIPKAEWMGKYAPMLTEGTYNSLLNKVSGNERKADKPVSWTLNDHEKEDLFEKLKLTGVLQKAASAKSVADLKRKTPEAQAEFTRFATEYERQIQEEFVNTQRRQPKGEELRNMRDHFVIEELKKAGPSYAGERYFFGLFGPRIWSKEEQAARLKLAGILDPNMPPPQPKLAPSRAPERPKEVSGP